MIQGDAFNRSRINTVVVAAVTSNLKYEALPGNVKLQKGESNIPKASVINVSQIHSIDRTYIEGKIGALSAGKMHDVRQGLRLLLGMD